MFPKGNVQQQVLSAGHVRQLSQTCQRLQPIKVSLEHLKWCCQKMILQKAIHLTWQEPME
jgi:hypothetical protein